MDSCPVAIAPVARQRHLRATTLLGIAGLTALLLAAALTILTPANAAPATVPLGTDKAYAILAGSTVTDTGPSVINGELGLSPGTEVIGFPPGIVNARGGSGQIPAATDGYKSATVHNRQSD